MNLYRAIIFLLLPVALIFPSTADAATPENAPQGLEILYIPREDLSRSPDYSDEGIFLPLSELRSLAEEAIAAKDAKTTWRGGVFCTSVQLSGALENSSGQLRPALAVVGQIEFESTREGWGAALLDDGKMPWTGQGTAKGASAFLARVGGRSYLFVKGPAKGSVAVKALFPASFSNAEATLSVGRFFAPCRIELDLGSKVEPLLSNSTGSSIIKNGTNGKGTALTLWPTQKESTRFRLRRRADYSLPSSLQVELKREVSVTGAAIEVSDALVLRDRFSPGFPLRVKLPKGLRLLRAEIGPGGTQDSSASNLACKSDARVEIDKGTLLLTPLKETDRILLEVVFVAELRDGKGRLGTWDFPALMEQAELVLRSSERYSPYVTGEALTASSAFMPAGGAPRERRYVCWDALPELEVELVALAPERPPEVSASLNLTQSEATVRYEVQFLDGNRTEFPFSVPTGWILTDVEVFRASSATPFSFQQTKPSHWRVSWGPETRPEGIRFALHRVGAWGASGTVSEIEAPLARFDGPRASKYDMRVYWPEAMEVRATSLTALSIVPYIEEIPAANVQPTPNQAMQVQRARQKTQGAPFSRSQEAVSRKPAPNLVLRARGSEPRAAFVIRGRNSDVGAMVVTALSVGEDRAKVRAMIAYSVRFAPAHTFKFLLPKGTGPSVRIENSEIREKTMRTTEEGDEWTVVAQRGVLGEFKLHLEWPLAGRPGEESILTPEIRVIGVSSQKGFVILEGSETLSLTMKTNRLATADVAELPDLPWTEQNRVLAVYRYVQPPFLLQVEAEKFEAESALKALVGESELTTTLSPEGVRLTRAHYKVTPTSDQQFFELRPPQGARVWSVLVNGEGVRPSRRSEAKGDLLLIPLPAASAESKDYSVTLLYREDGRPLAESTRLTFEGPSLSVPVNRTKWNLNMPPGFEYLAFGGSMMETAADADPAARYFRTAHYPDRLVFLDMSTSTLLIVFIGFLALFFLVRYAKVFTTPITLKTFTTPLFSRKKSLVADGRVPDSVFPPPIPVAKKSEGRGCFSSFALLFIVIGIIAILAAISVPNFLEAQVRSKVTRAKSDMRSIATAIESYMVDMNQYPSSLEILWQGPVKYLSSEVSDPYASHGGSSYSYRKGSAQTGFHYVQGKEAVYKGKRLGILPPNYPAQQSSFWMAYSVGPDGIDNGGEMLYDSTNGSTSAGDIVYVMGGGSSFNSRFTALGEGEEDRRRGVRFSGGGQSGSAPGLQPVPAAVASHDRTTLKPTPLPTPKPAPMPPPPMQQRPPPRPSVDIAGRAGNQPMGEKTEEYYENDEYYDDEDYDEGKSEVETRVTRGEPAGGPVSQTEDAAYSVGFNAGQDLFGVKSLGDSRQALPPPAPRHAGLLSLTIEIPEGGVQREFDALDGHNRMEIRVMESKRFLRLRFVVWMGVFLLLAGIWVLRRESYRSAFVVAIGIALLMPVIFNSVWIVFFNAALQGVLLSLVAPLLSILIQRFENHLPRGAISILFLVAALGISSSAGASESAQPKSGPPVPPNPHARILVPYDLSKANLKKGKIFESETDPLAYISKGDFTRLWNAIQTDPVFPKRSEAFIAELGVKGELLPEKAAIEGTLRILAVNPSNIPALVKLKLGGMAATEWSAAPEGAFLESSKEGLTLRLPPLWAGAVAAEFVLPCESTGGAGRLKLDFPETASGRWEIALPYADIVSAGPGAKGCVRERKGGKTTLLGNLRPGLLDLSWKGSGSEGRAGKTQSGDAWEAEISTQVYWSSLSGAHWYSTLQLRAAKAGETLPEEVRFRLDPNVRITSARGDKLLATEAHSSEIIFRLSEASSTEITLSGVMTLAAGEPATGNAKSLGEGNWIVGGIRPMNNRESKTTLRLEISDQIEVLAVRAEGLERRPTRAARSGVSVQIYETVAPDWRVSAELRPLRPAFTAKISEFFAPFDGFLRQAAEVVLSPRGGVLYECLLETPPGLRIATLEGAEVGSWIQSGQTILVAFKTPVENPVHFKLTAASELETRNGSLTLTPLSVGGASETRRSATVFVSADEELAEIDLAKATPRPPKKEDETLALLALSPVERKSGALRAYDLASGTDLEFGIEFIEATPLDKIYNYVTISEGLRKLDCIVQSAPRRGRLREVEVLLLLASPDPTAATRLQAKGPVRQIRTEALSERILRVTAELTAPQDRPVNVRFQLDQPLPVEETSSVGATLFVPSHKEGARTFLLLRRAFEGELTPSDAANVRPVDADEIPWPGSARGRRSSTPASLALTGGSPFSVLLPSDRAYEIPIESTEGPTFALSRHELTEELRAMVEILRLRTFLTADGFERCELEIVLQNRSEQFLKIALPYPKERVTIYQTLAASRAVKAAYGAEGGREVLLVPLIRTGLLDPELTVRIAYTVRPDTSSVMKGSGRREHRLPEILGGVPVAQSALVLYLPSDFTYSKFKGSLKPVGLVDLETDETLRQAKTAQRQSEMVLYSDKETQAKLGKTLDFRNAIVINQISNNTATNVAFNKNLGNIRMDQNEMGRQKALSKQRGAQLKQAQEFQKIAAYNFSQIQPYANITTDPVEPAAKPSVPATSAIKFPRVGDVLAFRRLQGTGNVTFRFKSKASADFRSDILFAATLTLFIAFLAFNSRRLFATARRAGFLLLVISLIALSFKVAVDMALPALAVACLLILMKHGKKEAEKTD